MGATGGECVAPPNSYDVLELAIQVFKGHYKSDKPDGVIPSGEAEVRHYAMETSISGGIVATICFSLSARLPRPLLSRRRRRRERDRRPYTLFFSPVGKLPGSGYSHVLARAGPRVRRIPPQFAYSAIRCDMIRRAPCVAPDRRPQNRRRSCWCPPVRWMNTNCYGNFASTGGRLRVGNDGLHVAYLNHHFICASQVDKQ